MSTMAAGDGAWPVLSTGDVVALMIFGFYHAAARPKQASPLPTLLERDLIVRVFSGRRRPVGHRLIDLFLRVLEQHFALAREAAAFFEERNRAIEVGTRL